ncbi:PREDICTED: DNA replication complex GINS protein PSF3-like [Tarenaya hassleriana]|uniref:DNA replication complex GINS protein PSF3-like n=1 Tax=Tarenaya hassleriana TaxID=28532 RepID=UPI00053C6D7E|nr:PREDICTED: DNA replication complex GINS protein PSF3-like [Tarenaya hassleriana]
MANYYDIDDILIEEEFVPVLFHKTANRVTIDPSAETNCVEQGAKVELPFWLAHELVLRQVLSINIPACFNQKTRLEIQADAACVDLKSRCPYFYEFGCKIEPLVNDRTIGILLSTAFKIRYKEILTKAYTSAHVTASKFLSLLTREETNLYEAAHSSVTAFKKWRIGGPRFQRASILGRKRKEN